MRRNIMSKWMIVFCGILAPGICVANGSPGGPTLRCWVHGDPAQDVIREVSSLPSGLDEDSAEIGNFQLGDATVRVVARMVRDSQVNFSATLQSSDPVKRELVELSSTGKTFLITRS